MKVESGRVPGMAVVSHEDAGAAEPPRGSLEQPRLGRNLSRLEARESGVTPLQHAVTKVAGLIAPPHQAIDGENPAGRPVNKDSLKDYVRAVLGMEHVATNIDPKLAPYLDELSKNGSTDGAQPVTQSSFTMLCILFMADQVPGSAAYGQFRRDTFMGWLNEQLPLGTAVPYDCIPERYFDTVQVSRRPETGVTLQYGRDGMYSVDVQPMRRANLQGANLQGADLRLSSADLRGASLRLPSADLRGADLRGASLGDVESVMNIVVVEKR